jgi:hypothetical protein
MRPIIGKKYIYKNINSDCYNKIVIVTDIFQHGERTLADIEFKNDNPCCIITDLAKNFLVPFKEDKQLELFE